MYFFRWLFKSKLPDHLFSECGILIENSEVVMPDLDGFEFDELQQMLQGGSCWNRILLYNNSDAYDSGLWITHSFCRAICDIKVIHQRKLLGSSKEKAIDFYLELGCSPNAWVECHVPIQAFKVTDSEDLHPVPSISDIIPEFYNFDDYYYDLDLDPERETYRITPLHLSILCADYKTIKQLLEAGADPFVKDEHGRTPLDLVHFNSKPPPINKLLRACMHKEQSENRVRPSDIVSHAIACSYKSEDELCDLVKNYFGSQLCDLSRGYDAPLMIAVRKQSRKVTKTLLRKGVLIEQKSILDGKTALAVAGTWKEGIDLLLLYGAMRNGPCQSKSSQFTHNCQTPLLRIVRQILECEEKHPDCTRNEQLYGALEALLDNSYDFYNASDHLNTQHYYNCFALHAATTGKKGPSRLLEILDDGGMDMGMRSRCVCLPLL